MQSIIGHEHIVRFFTEALEKGNCTHAYLFSGPLSVGKTTLVMELARQLLGNAGALHRHPDFYLLDPDQHEDRLTIPIDAVRMLERYAHLAPSIASGKVIAIAHADRCTSEAANALLKILEDPPSKTIFFLTTEYPARLPATVRSRMCRMQCSRVPHALLVDALSLRGIERVRAEACAILSHGCPGKALRIIENGDEEETVRAQFRLWLQLLHDPLFIFRADDLFDLHAGNLRSFLALGQRIIHDCIRISQMLTPRLLSAIATEEEQKTLVARYTVHAFAKMSAALLTATRFLHTNASPKLILENLFVSFV